MFVIKRNQVIITALVVMIAVAGYLNYIDGKSSVQNQIMLNDQGEISALVPDLTSTDDAYPDSEIGAAWTADDNPAIVMEAEPYVWTDEEAAVTIGPSSDGENAITEPGEAVFVNTTNDSSYFVQAKLDREQSRAKGKEILIDVINNQNIEQSKKAEAADAMMDIQKRIEKETAAEAMIEAKGFTEVYVRIDDDSVDVVVNKEALSDAEIAQIEDIVKRKTGMSIEKIHISPMRR